MTVGKASSVPTEKEALGPKDGVDALQKRKNCCVYLKSNHDLPVFQPVDYSLYRLRHAGAYRVEIKFKLLPAYTGKAAVNTQGS